MKPTKLEIMRTTNKRDIWKITRKTEKSQMERKKNCTIKINIQKSKKELKKNEKIIKKKMS